MPGRTIFRKTTSEPLDDLSSLLVGNHRLPHWPLYLPHGADIYLTADKTLDSRFTWHRPLSLSISLPATSPPSPRLPPPPSHRWSCTTHWYFTARPHIPYVIYCYLTARLPHHMLSKALTPLPPRCACGRVPSASICSASIGRHSLIILQYYLLRRFVNNVWLIFSPVLLSIKVT